jgi:exopolysaccharide biosynthesis polyprenyl glycosylphosphotransferase
MLGRKQELNLQFLQIADGLLMVASFWLAHSLRSIGAGLPLFQAPIGPFSEFQWLLFVILPFGPILLELQGFYVHPVQKSLRRSFEQVLRAFFWLGLLIAACGFFLKLSIPSRAVMPLFALLAGLALMSRDRLIVYRFRQRATREDLREKVVLAGTPRDVQLLREQFTPAQQAELAVVAEIDIERQPIEVLVEALHQHAVSRVIFAGGQSHLGRLQEAISACETEGVEAWLVADFIRQPVLVFRTTPDLSWALMIKSAIDRLGALVLLVLTSWLMLAVVIAIRCTSPGPIVFRQKRAGKNGRPFTMYKFRSMQTDAEMLQSELAAFNQMSGPVFKLARDPRITPVGRFIRKTSLDELPQLLNVLRGDMSLVGPRPLPLYEVEKFESTAQRRRLSMKPGITCLWQIGGRNEVKNFDQWVKLPAVLFGAGAR